MKRIWMVLLLLAGFNLVRAAEPQAEIKFDKTLHDFGSFSEKNPVVTCTFTFTNIGDAPLIIKQALATCGCTVPTFTETPIEPGKTGTLTVKYNGKNRYPGDFRKVITVSSNAKNKLVSLTIRGNMTKAEE